MSEQRLVVLAYDEGDGLIYEKLLEVPADLDLAAVKQERSVWYQQHYLPGMRDVSKLVEYRSLLDFLKEKGCVVVPVEVLRG